MFYIVNTLSNSYGRRKQMLCGVHFNFEFGDELIQALFNVQSEIKDYRHFKDRDLSKSHKKLFTLSMVSHLFLWSFS